MQRGRHGQVMCPGSVRLPVWERDTDKLCASLVGCVAPLTHAGCTPLDAVQAGKLHCLGRGFFPSSLRKQLECGYWEEVSWGGMGELVQRDLGVEEILYQQLVLLGPSLCCWSLLQPAFSQYQAVLGVGAQFKHPGCELDPGGEAGLQKAGGVVCAHCRMPVSQGRGEEAQTEWNSASWQLMRDWQLCNRHQE